MRQPALHPDHRRWKPPISAHRFSGRVSGRGFLWVCLLFLIQACTTTNVPRIDLSSRRGLERLEVAPEVRVHHFTPDSSRFYISLNTDNLLYSKVSTGEFTGVVEVTLTAESLDESVATEKMIVLQDPDSTRRPKRIMGETAMWLPEGHEYNLVLTFVDGHSGKSAIWHRSTDKTSPNHRDYFLVTRDGLPLFHDRVQTGEPYAIRILDTTAEALYVNYYKTTFPWPPPPFSYYEPEPFDYTPDLKYELALDGAGRTVFRAGQPGFYHFRLDTTSREGLTLFTTEGGFPLVSRTEDLLGPIRYILSGKEYEALLDSENPKAAMEKLWLDWSGTKDRARRSLTAFYGRVEEANRRFTSHVEGWKSDRGLIYIIYGKPGKIYRYEAVETWIYGEENNPMSITFHFVRVINPFTDNDFRLDRHERYKPSWYRSIDAWRSGRGY